MLWKMLRKMINEGRRVNNTVITADKACTWEIDEKLARCVSRALYYKSMVYIKWSICGFLIIFKVSMWVNGLSILEIFFTRVWFKVSREIIITVIVSKRGKCCSWRNLLWKKPISSILFTVRLTYEIAPIQLLIEQQVLSKMRTLAGFSKGDGIFLPGK